MYLDRLEFASDPLRGFDGRCRVLAATAVISAAVITVNIVLLCGMIAISLALLCREIRVTALRLVPVNMMTLLLWVPVLAGASPGNMAIYTLRINAAALFYMLFLCPLRVSVLASAMTALHAPEKLTALFVLTWRYIFLLYGGIAASLASMRQRQRGGGHLRRWRSLAAVFSTAIVRAVFRAEQVSRAMINRGFDGAFPPTAVFSWRLRDSLLLAGSMAVLLSAAALFVFSRSGARFP
ncbi:MAG: energy-coupling factor transporter transmembrane protein EcfT [Spirochaetaceae bacterium]|jgi:cobalt/nickel transport system permease protein|nr:energy-coupling factor transporter transmembrane protein EcfT [Spirochaetaceae bacterium]